MRMDFYSDLLSKATGAEQADVSGDGSKFEALVVAESFAGLSTIKRHKQVYSVLEEYIKSGAIHALSIKTYTPEEFSALQA